MTVEQLALIDAAALTKLSAGIAIGFGAIGGGLGIGIATKGISEAVARQPEAKDELFKNFIIGAALAEATAIYALFIALVIIFK